MQKYLGKLEENVQWIAIALGALFVGFMTWSYVLNSPAQVTIGPETLGPGEIDPFTVEKVVTPLDAAINNTDKIQLDVPKHVKRFQDEMAWKTAAPTQDFSIVYASQPKDVELPPAPIVPNNPNQPPSPNQPPPGPQGEKVASLPIIPAPTPGDHRFGRSLVIPPLGLNEQQPVVVAGQIDPRAVDKDWVTQVFKVKLEDIDKAFNEVRVPAGDLRKTVFLQVVLEREEMDSNGKFDPKTRTVIEPLPGVSRNPGQPTIPYPPAGSPKDLYAGYLGFAAANQGDIIQPLFFTTVPQKGDQWTKPGDQPVGQVVFDPATFKGNLDTLPPDQRELVTKYRRDKYKADQDAKKASHPAAAPRSSPTGGRGGPPGGEGAAYAPAPAAPPRGIPLPPGRPPIRTGVPGFRGGPIDEMEGGNSFGGGQQTVQVQGLPAAGTDYPSADFDPGAPEWKGKTVEIWGHDTTIKSGKTYRYRIRYKIKNPLFATNAGAKPELNAVFDLTSKDADNWASPITIPQLVNFFVQSSKAPNGNTVRFEVFKWEKGTQTNETFSVGPGDQIGAPKGAVDFSTDWTVVDFRFDARQNDTQILLVNNKDGSVAVRSYQADLNDLLYKGLKEQIQQLKAAQAAAGPVSSAAGAGAPAR